MTAGRAECYTKNLPRGGVAFCGAESPREPGFCRGTCGKEPLKKVRKTQKKVLTTESVHGKVMELRPGKTRAP